MKHHFLYLLAIILFASCAKAPVSNPIKVNQVGYYPDAKKVAVLDNFHADTVRFVNAEGVCVGLTGCQCETVSPWSGKKRAIVDFSMLTIPGEYTIQAGEYTQTVTIREHALEEVAKAAMKAFYLQRSGIAIEEEYAGIYARPLGHPDTLVYIHESAATETRPAESTISSPYGWYDAGDYNKYIVNSGFAIGAMLIGYEMAPDYYDTIDLNIPESGNDVPDFLDEIMFNLRWMATMQDEDGGVYHKLTEPAFEGFIKPTDCKKPRYVVQKGTAASLDFAAVMAMAYRLYKHDGEYGAFVMNGLEQAKRAFAWAEQHPEVYYTQNANNKVYNPAITTGAYDDEDCRDEFFWAATELFFATGDEYYLQLVEKHAPAAFAIPSWGGVDGLGIYEWLLQAPGAEFCNPYYQSLLSAMDERLAEIPASCFAAPSGNRPEDFGWGCTGEHFAGQGQAMLLAYQLTDNEQYLAGAIADADYLLGRNATGYCYVTGFGSQRVMHPHHRLSASDGIDDPLPGFMAGGPNPKQQDLKEVPGGYASDYADESYEDKTPSYASNEIAINWNAYLVALLWGIEATR